MFSALKFFKINRIKNVALGDILLIALSQLVFFVINIHPEVQNFKKSILEKVLLLIPKTLPHVPIVLKIFEIILITIVTQICNWCLRLLVYKVKRKILLKQIRFGNEIKRKKNLDSEANDRGDSKSFNDALKINKHNILQSIIVYKKRKKFKYRCTKKSRDKIKLMCLLVKEKLCRKLPQNSVETGYGDVSYSIYDNISMYYSPLQILNLQLKLRLIQLKLTQKKFQAMRLMLEL